MRPERRFSPVRNGLEVERVRLSLRDGGRTKLGWRKFQWARHIITWYNMKGPLEAMPTEPPEVSMREANNRTARRMKEKTWVGRHD